MNQDEQHIVDYFEGKFSGGELEAFNERLENDTAFATLFEEYRATMRLFRDEKIRFWTQPFEDWKREMAKFEGVAQKTIQSHLKLNFDFSIIIDALEIIEHYFNAVIPNRYAYSFVPNFVSEGANEDVLFRVREAEMEGNDLISFFKLLEEESGKRLLLVFGDGKVLLNLEDNSQVSQVLTKLKERSTSFKIEFSD